MDEGMGYLIGIGIVLFLLYLFVVYIVLPIVGIVVAIGAILMTTIAGAGTVKGTYIGLKNFIKTFNEANKELANRP